MIKLIAAIVVAALIIIGVVFGLSRHNTPGTTNNTSQNSTGSAAANSSQAPAAGTINIRDMMFTPSQISVAKGGTVTWTNNDTTTHTVVDDLSNVGGPNSGDIAAGSSYSFTFNKTGSFQYHCSIHPSMRGTIVVK